MVGVQVGVQHVGNDPSVLLGGVDILGEVERGVNYHAIGVRPHDVREATLATSANLDHTRAAELTAHVVVGGGPRAHAPLQHRTRHPVTGQDFCCLASSQSGSANDHDWLVQRNFCHSSFELIQGDVVDPGNLPVGDLIWFTYV